MKNYHIFIGVNEKKDVSFSITKKLLSILNHFPTTLYSDTNLIKIFPQFCLQEITQETSLDFIILIGGDGTFLSYAQRFVDKQTPIVGINLGRIGYLSSIQPNQIEEKIPDLFAKKYQLQSRFLLTTQDNFTAINEICIHHGNILKILKIGVQINQNEEQIFYADGVIVATPTGSSAYNYSAGGMILPLSLEKIVITPICPNQRAFSSFVVNANDCISIQIYAHRSKCLPILSIDGKFGRKIKYGEKIQIQKSVKMIQTIQF